MQAAHPHSSVKGREATALPSSMYVGGVSHQREQQETLPLVGDPSVGQGGKVTASRASKGISECMEAWRTVMAFLLVLTL